MPESFTEQNYENSVIELFENLGYTHVYGPSVDRDFYNPVYEDILLDALVRINKDLPREAIEEAFMKIKDIEGSREAKNITFTEYLQNGVPVRYYSNKQEENKIVYIVDYQNVDNNSFIVANQWTFIENSEKRPDILIFLNGIPVVLVELKSPSREETEVSEAYNQIRNYMHEIPSMFIYNQICVISDQLTTKAGTITSNEDRYMEWKTVDGDYSNTQFATFDTFFNGIFPKERFLDILKNFICFSYEGDGPVKILAGYHQYFAVKKAIDSTIKAMQTNGKGGVFWHTQGSGKSLSMVFYAHLLQSALINPTIVVLTDRNDLDDQLYGQFSKCKLFLRQDAVQAKDRKHLKELLKNTSVNGIFFTTMHKFTESQEPLSERHNVIVLADEAHRSQYGLVEKVRISKDKETGEEKAQIIVGAARKVRDSLPNATYIGFTGTPISKKDKDTQEVFGDYIDIYDMTQAVEDGATRPVYYESRVIKLKLDDATLKLIDDEYKKLNAEEEAKEKSKKELGKLESILGHDNTLNSLVDDILEHYENNRQYLLTGKAMIVAYSREIAINICKKIREKRKGWNNKVKTVITRDNKDPEDWKPFTSNKSEREDLAKEFKNNDSEFKIAIVVDMWLTGFDVPSLATMYVYKPMSGHNLMQAIARVNRVFKNKEGGLVVDYVGIAAALKEAMHEYSDRDQKNYGDTDIKNEAYKKFLEKFSVCRDLFHGFDYSKFMTGSDLERAQTINDGLNFLLAPSKIEQRDLYAKEALMLKQALSLCSSIVGEGHRIEAAYFETIRVMLSRFLNKGDDKKLSLPEINAAINALLKQSVKTEGIVNLFSDVKEEFSIFDEKFLAEIAKMKQKNLAVELLKKLIAEQIRVYKHTNVVKSEEFSDILHKSLNSYINGLIDSNQVINEMIEMAKLMKQARDAGNNMGLNEDEMAFYDALLKPDFVKEAAKDDNDKFIQIAKDLTDKLRKNRTVDWDKKDDARAKMKAMIKRLLRAYGYPPKKSDEALENVMRQCENWVDNNSLVQDALANEQLYHVAEQPAPYYI